MTQMVKLSELLKTKVDAPSQRVMPGYDDMIRTVEGIEKRWGATTVSADEFDLKSDLDAYLDRLRTGNWNKYGWYKAAQLFRDLMSSRFRDDSNYQTVKKSLFATLSASSKKTFLRAATQSALDCYGESNADVDRLYKLLANTPSKDLPLSEYMIEEIGIFANREAHKVAALKLSQSIDLYKEVQSWGVIEPHSCNFCFQAFQTYLTSVNAKLMKLDRLSRQQLMSWLTPQPNKIGDRYIGMCVDALISPLQSTTDPSVRKELLDYLVANLEDLRVNSAKWADVSEDSCATVRSWLTDQTLEFFFDVISRFEESHMWADRKNFWTKINKKNWIKNAWVVLDEQTSKDLERSPQEREAHASHGTYNLKKDKFYFLMEIGNLIVVEGTHSFSVKIWPKASRQAPRLNKKQYDVRHLTDDPTKRNGRKFPHLGDWPLKVETYLRNNRK